MVVAGNHKILRMVSYWEKKENTVTCWFHENKEETCFCDLPLIVWWTPSVIDWHLYLLILYICSNLTIYSM